MSAEAAVKARFRKFASRLIANGNAPVDKARYSFALNKQTKKGKKDEELSVRADSSRKTNTPGVMDDSCHTEESETALMIES